MLLTLYHHELTHLAAGKVKAGHMGADGLGCIGQIHFDLAWPNPTNGSDMATMIEWVDD